MGLRLRLTFQAGGASGVNSGTKPSHTAVTFVLRSFPTGPTAVTAPALREPVILAINLQDIDIVGETRIPGNISQALPRVAPRGNS